MVVGNNRFRPERQVNVGVANKRIKKVKKQRNWLLFGIVICIIIIIFLYFAGLSIVTNYSNIYGGDDTTTTTYMYNDIIYDDGIFVHKDGDNSTGDNWEEAYTTLNGAIFETSPDLDDKTIIFVALGLFDVNVAGQLNITKNVHIVGNGRDGTIFTNTHDDAVYILNASQYFKIEHCGILIGDEYSGILLSNETVDAHLIHMKFEIDMEQGDAPSLLFLYNISHGEFEDLHFDGNGHCTVIIHINGSNHNHFSDIELFSSKSGITFDGVNTDENHIIYSRFFNLVKAIDIRSGNNQHFMDLCFAECVYAVDDEVGDSTWLNIYTDEMLGAVVPADLVGIDVDGDAVARTYGVDTIVFDATDIDSPFYITAVLFEPDANERYGLRIWDAFSATYIYETVLEAKFAGQIDRHEIPVSMILNAHTIVYISIKSETGGDDMDIWLEIIAIV